MSYTLANNNFGSSPYNPSQNSLDEDDLVVLVYSVLVDPVRVQDPQVGTSTTDTLLGGSLETSLELEVVDTLPNGLTVGGT